MHSQKTKFNKLYNTVLSPDGTTPGKKRQKVNPNAGDTSDVEMKIANASSSTATTPSTQMKSNPAIMQILFVATPGKKEPVSSAAKLLTPNHFNIMQMFPATTFGKKEPVTLTAKLPKPTIQPKPRKANVHFTFEPLHTFFKVDVPSAAELRESHKYHKLAALLGIGVGNYRYLQGVRSVVGNKIRENIKIGKQQGILKADLDVKKLNWDNMVAYALEVEEALEKNRLNLITPQLRR